MNVRYYTVTHVFNCSNYFRKLKIEYISFGDRKFQFLSNHTSVQGKVRGKSRILKEKLQTSENCS